MITAFFITAAVLLIIGLPVSFTVGSAAMVYIFGTGMKPSSSCISMMKGMANAMGNTVPFPMTVNANSAESTSG